MWHVWGLECRRKGWVATAMLSLLWKLEELLTFVGYIFIKTYRTILRR